MSDYPVKLPDVGEGVAEAELVSWLVEVGQHVDAEAALAEVLTDKATVEIAAPVGGVIRTLHVEPGEMLAVGAVLVTIEVDQGAAAPSEPPPVQPAPVQPAPVQQLPVEPTVAAALPTAAGPTATGASRPTASPAVRRRAKQLGIDLAAIRGSGPQGMIVHHDLDRLLTSGSPRATHPPAGTAASASAAATVIPVRGLRRRIAERLTQSWTEIPHITYVEEVDAEALETLRAAMNRSVDAGSPRLTLLPFIARAIVVACADQPRLNARYDGATRELTVPDAVHLGVATHTDDGLMVPVVRHAEQCSLSELAAEIVRLAGAARDGSATVAELGGSTITVTSLGAIGGLATTPIINQPEVSIVGVNKMEIRPVWMGAGFVPRRRFNLSASFDHRIVDGFDAATFVQRLKTLLEVPALLFTDEHG